MFVGMKFAAIYWFDFDVDNALKRIFHQSCCSRLVSSSDGS